MWLFSAAFTAEACTVPSTNGTCLTGVRESQNHSVVWVRKDLKDLLIPSSWPWGGMAPSDEVAQGPIQLLLQLLCLKRDWGCVMDWSSAEDSLMIEAEPPWEFLICSNVDSMLPAKVLKTLYIIIYTLVFITDPAEMAVNP